MKTDTFRKVGFFMLLCFPAFAFAQPALTLSECWESAHDNYPKLKQTELLQQVTLLNKENLRTAYLPQIELKGQASYQSDVVKLPITIPGITIPSMSKDQYKVYFDVKQSIWDGGITKAQEEIEDVSLDANLMKVEVDAFQIKNMVSSYYFGALVFDENMAVLAKQKEVLTASLNRMQSAANNGAARIKDLENLQAEVLKLDQQQIDLQSRRAGMVKALAILTGKTLAGDVPLETPEALSLQSMSIRPELKLFDIQNEQITAGNSLLDATRYPKFYGFGQAGYGRPGLNMLNNAFDTYYIVGVGASWQVTDWKKVRRNKEANARQMEVVETMRDDFNQKQQAQLDEISEKIEGVKAMMKTDDDIVKLRESIAKRSAGELDAGTITSSDYLTDVNAESVARINAGIHKLQLVQLVINYNTILGY
jgi:outer membrane protein TolC